MSRIAVCAAIAAALGCGEIPERTSPEGAFARMAPCVDTASVACLFAELDRDSRWSSQTIWRTLDQTKQIVFSAYPEERRKAALGIWYEQAHTADGAGFFELFCREKQCLKHLARGFGAVVRVIPQDASNVVVETTRGARFPMAEADGQWGYAIYRDELQKTKIRVSDRLAQVKQNASELETMRLSEADTTPPAKQPLEEEK